MRSLRDLKVISFNSFSLSSLIDLQPRFANSDNRELLS